MSHTEKLTVATRSDREIVMTRRFHAPRALVFDALTKPEILKRWLNGPEGWSLPVCEIDLRVGGAFRYVWRGPDGTEMGMSGVFREIAPPARMVHTELFDEDWTGGETLVTTELEESDGGTTLTTTVLYASQEGRDGALKSGMEQGLGESYDTLDDLFAQKADSGSGAGT